MKTIILCRQFFIFTSIALYSFSQICNSMEAGADKISPHFLSRLIEPIKVKKLTTKQRYSPHVVFDMDDVLCIQLEKIQNQKNNISLRFPDSPLIPFRHQNHSYPHFFYPYFGEVFLTLLQWGWSVDFFSSGQEIRNTNVIPHFLKMILSPYSNHIEIDYSALIDAGEFRVFSRHHMIRSTKKMDDLLYHTYGEYKKDLSIISADIQDTILIDDDPSYVIGGEQYPFIGMSFSASLEFKTYLSSKKVETGDFENKDYINPLNNAAYILGILNQCKIMIDESAMPSKIHLRTALDHVLRRPENISSDILSDSQHQTPWFLYPGTKYNPKTEEWIEQGNTLIQQIRQQATRSKTTPIAFYDDLEAKLEVWENEFH